MDKEDIADSHKSTLTTSEQAKGTIEECSSIYLEKRKIEDVNLEFDKLMASVSDSSKSFSFFLSFLAVSDPR